MTVQVSMEAVMAEQDQEDPRVRMGSVVYWGRREPLIAVAAFLAENDAVAFAETRTSVLGGLARVVDYDTRKTTVIGSVKG